MREGLNVLEEAFEQVKGHQITAMEAEKLAGKMLQKTNEDETESLLGSEAAQRMDARGAAAFLQWMQIKMNHELASSQ